MNLIIGQRISTKREDFIITNPTIIYNKCYSTLGNNVYTCNKSKTYIGIELSLWETIRNLSAGQTYEHTITKSELYYGQKVTYYAPFDKCDRVEDYKTAWTHFKKIFEKNL